MNTAENYREAIRLMKEGMAHLDANRSEDACDCLEQSLSLHPTADAYTQLGRLQTMRGRFQDAIRMCYMAIDLDPDYGNPYNDIGVCLVRLEKFEEAMRWFEKAKLASRYGTPHFPYLNMGSMYVKLGRLARAYREFQKVLELVPNQPDALQFVKAMEQLLEAEKKPVIVH